jgi:hypothetical protein
MILVKYTRFECGLTSFPPVSSVVFPGDHAPDPPTDVSVVFFAIFSTSQNRRMAMRKPSGLLKQVVKLHSKRVGKMKRKLEYFFRSRMIISSTYSWFRAMREVSSTLVLCVFLNLLLPFRVWFQVTFLYVKKVRNLATLFGSQLGLIRTSTPDLYGETYSRIYKRSLIETYSHHYNSIETY